jgi:hypothetical protein
VFLLTTTSSKATEKRLTDPYRYDSIAGALNAPIFWCKISAAKSLCGGGIEQEN